MIMSFSKICDEYMHMSMYTEKEINTIA